MIRPDLVDKGILKTGDIIVQHSKSYWYKPSTWPARVIRKMTDSNWNHSAEVLVVHGEVFVIEALGGWITVSRWKEFCQPGRYISVLRMKWFESKFHEKEYIIKAAMQLDKRYDYFWIFKLFIYICSGWWVNPSKSISEKNWRCSEYNAWMKDLSGWQAWLPKDFTNNPDFVELV